MSRTMDTLPGYLRTYCIEHDVEKYTPRDHASWRYIMRRAVPFFRKHAVSTYEDGLQATGITLDRIPHVDDMDRSLQKIGWGAVPVCGFIPPWAFLEFQARQILPIATDMRSVDHIAYTPAPDIVHEAAGHAPILPDVEYNQYLSYYAKLGTKAIYSKQDLQLYEAVRYLSDIKEKPDSRPADIQDAERRLLAATKAFTYVSEAAKVGRMSWWTAEYGLAGDMDAPKIFGAGLLSSVGESESAMTAKVNKLPLSLDCTNYPFNITEPQPQLFVATDMQHLHDVLHELDGTLSYRTGGLDSLQRAIESEAVTTTVLDSGLEISGVMTQFIFEDTIQFIKYSGPVQLCKQGVQLEGQGISRHGSGYSSPLGPLTKFPESSLGTLSPQQLQQLNLVEGQQVDLDFCSGFRLSGRLKKIYRHQGDILYFTFQDCRVNRGSDIFFEAEWGEFDLAVGNKVVSVYGGPACRETYGEHEIIHTATHPGRELPYTSQEREVFQRYQELRDVRGSNTPESTAIEKIKALTTLSLEQSPEEWLLLLELFETGQKLRVDGTHHAWFSHLRDHLHNPSQFTPDSRQLLKHGLDILH